MHSLAVEDLTKSILNLRRKQRPLKTVSSGRISKMDVSFNRSISCFGWAASTDKRRGKMTENWQSFLIVQSRHLFVYFHPFYITIQLQYKKHWCCCTCDSNPRYAQAGQLSYDDRSSVVNLTNASQSYLLRRQSGGC